MGAITSEFVSPSESLRLHVAYFDTSAWNNLADHPKYETIVAELQRSHVIVLASVISAGEILKTPARGRVERLRSVS